MGNACANGETDQNGRFGAGDGIRTRDINLGKVALYQLSYSRPSDRQVTILAPLVGNVKYVNTV